ncbi:hypothetical protein N2152v2_000975 [Parachlorella kessleri]
MGGAHQQELATQVRQEDAASWHLGDTAGCSLRLVGGLDISCATQPTEGSSGDTAVAALVVLSFPALSTVYEDFLQLQLEVPYLPGFLGFRECPAYMQLLERAREAGVVPQVLLVDGFGVLHPRRLGSASQLGVLAGVATIGVAKNLLAVDGLPGEREVRAAMRAGQWAQQSGHSADHQDEGQHVVIEHQLSQHESKPGGFQRRTARLAGLRFDAVCQLGSSAAATAGPGGLRVPPDPSAPAIAIAPAPPVPAAVAEQPHPSTPMAPRLMLRGEGDEVLGAAVCPPGCQHPIYVSVGHLVSLPTAVDITLRCCRHRVPEPIRQADLKSRERVRQLAAKQA